MNNYKEVRVVYKDGESKSKPFQTLMQPTLFEATKDAAAEDGVSVNEYINQALREKIARDSSEPAEGQINETPEIIEMLHLILVEVRFIADAVTHAVHHNDKKTAENIDDDEGETADNIIEFATGEHVADKQTSQVTLDEFDVPAPAHHRMKKNKTKKNRGNTWGLKNKTFYKASDVAEVLEVSRETADEYAAKKIIPAIRIGHPWLFTEETMRDIENGKYPLGKFKNKK